jgi:hypothetical protein
LETQADIVTVYGALVGAFARFAVAILKCGRAAVSPLTALMLIPISGAVAYSVEIGSWQYWQRSMQNAADSAALAAATNNASNYDFEGKAAAQKFGFVNLVGNTKVKIDGNVSCPSGFTTCYAATISTTFPLMFSRLVGFKGDGTGRQTITAYAKASADGGGINYAYGCFYALGQVSGSFQGNGIPDANLTGCSIFSQGQIGCTGSNGAHADYALSSAAPGTYSPSNTPCSSSPTNSKYGVTLPTIPYGTGSDYEKNAADAMSNATSPTCTNSQTQGQQTATLLVYCGNVKLTGDLTLKSPNTVVVINGSLDLNKNTLSTAPGASATIIFSGTSDPFGANSSGTGGTLDIQAPSTSASLWQGVAMYQQFNPSASNTGKVDFNGKQSTVQITGAVYFPQENVTINGIVNGASSGPTCFLLYSYTVTINGNGTYLNETSGCTSAGVSPPKVAVGTRAKLVQ